MVSCLGFALALTRTETNNFKSASASFKSQASIRLALQKVEGIRDLKSGKLDGKTRAASDADILGYQAKTLQVFLRFKSRTQETEGQVPHHRSKALHKFSTTLRHTDGAWTGGCSTF